MRNLGQLFNEIRVSKGFTRKDVCGNQLSPQFLGKFERGESDISLTNFCYILEQVNVTYDEFFAQAQTTTKEIIDSFNQQFETAMEMKNHTGLRQLKEQYEALFVATERSIYQHLAGVCHYYFSRMTGGEDTSQLVSLKKYLSKVESWTLYEYYLAYLIVATLSHEELLGISEVAYKRGIKQSEVRRYANKLLITVILFLLEMDEISEAEQLLSKRKQIFPLSDQELYENAYWQYLNGLILIRKNNQSGIEIVERSIGVWKSIDGYELYANSVSSVFDKNLRKSNLIFKEDVSVD